MTTVAEKYRCRLVEGGSVEERTEIILALDVTMAAEGFVHCHTEVDEEETLVLYRRSGIAVRPVMVELLGSKYVLY